MEGKYDDMSKGHIDPEKIIAESAEQLPRLPDTDPDRTDVVTRGAVVSLVVGATTYTVLPELANLNQAGLTNDLIALTAAGASGFLASIRRVQHLCWISGEGSNEGRWNIAKGGIGGLLGGLSAGGALTPGVFTLPFDGGLTLAGLALGAGGVTIYNRIKKVKYCPHKDCGKKGNCQQRVCRHCYRIFYPADEKLDCSKYIGLTWFQIASYLQQQGLTYLDAAALYRKHVNEWQVYKAGEGENVDIKVDCEAFSKWASEHKAEIMGFQGVGKEGKTTEELQKQLEWERV